jgi:hypothetical protein
MRQLRCPRQRLGRECGYQRHHGIVASAPRQDSLHPGPARRSRCIEGVTHMRNIPGGLGVCLRQRVLIRRRQAGLRWRSEVFPVWAAAGLLPRTPEDRDLYNHSRLKQSGAQTSTQGPSHYLDEPRNEEVNTRLKPPRQTPKNRMVGGAQLRRRRQAARYES